MGMQESSGIGNYHHPGFADKNEGGGAGWVGRVGTTRAQNDPPELSPTGSVDIELIRMQWALGIFVQANDNLP